MGRRCRCSRKPKSFSTISAVPEPCLPGVPTSEYELSDPIKIIRKVRLSISEIYFEHRGDLKDRKKRRLEHKQPVDYFHPYNLVVNSQFQAAIKLQIQLLIKYSLGDMLKESLITCMNEFIEYLCYFIKDFDDKRPLLQAIMIYEAYHTLLNSIGQIGSIISDLITKYAFEVINKKCFYEKIASNYVDLLQDACKTKSCKYLEEIRKMVNDLKSLDKIYDESVLIENASTFYSDSCSESEENNSEALHNLPLDDIVRIINGDRVEKKQESKKKKNKKLEEIDREVEEFVVRINEVKDSKFKSKPQVSNEFLAELRKKIERLKAN